MPALIPANQARTLMDTHNAVMIDIREPADYQREHIPASRLAPISVLADLPPDPDRDRPAIFVCRDGRCTTANQALLLARGFTRSYLLDGGLEAWKRESLPVNRNPIPRVERQEQTGLGLAVLGSVLLVDAWPMAAWVAGMGGTSLLLAGLTGHNPVSSLLARLPWNRPGAVSENQSQESRSPERSQ